jgi:hypothetical protein
MMQHPEAEVYVNLESELAHDFDFGVPEVRTRVKHFASVQAIIQTVAQVSIISGFFRHLKSAILTISPWTEICIRRPVSPPSGGHTNMHWVVEDLELDVQGKVEQGLKSDSSW